MKVAHVSAKGQITLPVEMRRKVGISANSLVSVELRESGELVIRPLKKVHELYGFFAEASTCLLYTSPSPRD